MDDIVRQAMAKWPNVPNCFGWLGLDERGQWYMRDDSAQALGAFASGVAGAKGSLLQHEKLIGFIGRNYAPDPSGQWFFQNGPQRVFVELQNTPWVWRVADDFSMQSHTGTATEVIQCYADETGKVYLSSRMGIGLVHSLDVAIVAKALEAGHWELEQLRKTDLPQRFGYVASPAANEHKSL